LNKLNNQRHNLRECTQSQNAANSKLYSNSSCGLKGVTFNKYNGKWMARILVNGQRIHLGYFPDPIIAHKAYKDASERYFGEFANTGVSK
jgi:hypothetical protein